VVEEDRQGRAVDLQRSRRERRRQRDRCIIPASGYSEWKTMPNGKQPYFVSAADGGVLSIAGLWDRWHSTDTGETVLSCTMIVTDANAFTRAVGRLGCGCCAS